MNQAQGPTHTERDWRVRGSRLQTLFDAIEEGYCVAEMILNDMARPLTIAFSVDPLFEQMTGLVHPVGKTALELVPDLERMWIEKYARVALDGETLEAPVGERPSGKRNQVSVNG
jgi:hypothetical protein